MAKSEKNIDQLLHGLFDNAEMDADGIDWNSFEQKRSKKRAAFWWRIISTATLIIGIGSWAYFSMFNKNHQSKKVNLPHTDLHHPENMKAKEQPIIDTSDIKKENTITEKLHEFKRVKPDSKPKEIQVNDSPISMVSTKNSIELPRFVPKSFQHQHTPHFVIFDTIINSNSIIYKLSNLISDSLPLLKTAENVLKLSLGPNYNAPTISAGSISSPSRNHKDYTSIRNSSEVANLGIDFSLTAGKKYAKITPMVGLGFSHYRVLAHYNFDYSERPILEKNGTIIGYTKLLPQNIRFNSAHHYSFVQLPLSVSYDITQKNKIGLSFLAQFTPQMLIASGGQTPNAVYLNEVETFNSSNYKQGNLAFNVGFTLWRRNENYRWFIEPTYGNNFGLSQIKGIYSVGFNSFSIKFGFLH
ncbi:MAG: hypothetical protein H6607_00090 [Flavobacteriales bacterium]|nr:hypothetical protein [Flavobacteriales bacterium]